MSAPKPAVAAATPKSSTPKSAAVKAASVKATPVKATTVKAAAVASPAGKAKPVSKPVAQPAAFVQPAKAAKRKKPVRDSFTMPEADFTLIARLKARLLAAQRETKKSELLRAGLHVLAALDTPTLVASLSRLDPIKVGRPKKGH